MTIESPCIGVCQLEEDKEVCAGCHRTLAEIAAWPRLTDEEKRYVLQAIRDRSSKGVQDKFLHDIGKDGAGRRAVI
jgi:predicted Fe-S protein YdhL (DUF1289 family)